MEAAVFGSNEGRRDADALPKKLEPKQNELKAQNDELEGLQKQLQTQGDKLNEDARATLVKQIETKKKSLDRAVQDFQEDGQNQGKEIFSAHLAEDGSHHREVRPGQWIRADCGHLEPVAAKPGPVVGGRRGHHEGDR